MTKQVSFRPEFKKATSKSNGNTEILLVVSNGSLVGSLDTLNEMLGKTVSVDIRPESYAFKTPFNKVTGKPNIEYTIKPDGTTEILKEEQTALDLADGAQQVEYKETEVPKDVIDDFIKTASTLKYPSSITINPRSVLIRMEQGDTIADIAKDYEVSDYTLINQLEFARQHYAPFANVWNQDRGAVIFAESDSETPNDDKKAKQGKQSVKGKKATTDKLDGKNDVAENSDAEAVE